MAGRKRVTRWIAAYLALGALFSALLLTTGDSLLRTGRFVESVPVPILLIAAAATVALAITLRHERRPYVPWLGLGLVCLFLAGEEAKWGHEPVFGVQVFPGDGWDIHNRVVHRYVEAFSPIDLESGAGVVFVSIVGAGAVAAVLFYSARCIGARRVGLPAVFLLGALAFAILGFTVDVLDLALERFFENRVGIMKWAVEEMSEIMAALALLFAPLSRLTSLRPSQPRRFDQI